MAVTIASWNIEGRLTRYMGGKNRGTPEKIINEIAELNADIVVLPESYLNAPDKKSNKLLSRLGYQWYDVQYHDTLHDEDVAKWGYPFMRVLYKIPIVRVETKRWGDIRNLPLITAVDLETKKEFYIIATHLDDITEGRRLQQLSEIIPFIQKSKLPVIMLGDFNAMWHGGWQQILRTKLVKWGISIVPTKDLRDVLTRLSRMATGKVMEELRDKAGLRDIDPKHRPTTTPKMRGMPWMPSIRLVQIDHMLVSKNIEVSVPKIGKDGGSDHRSLATTIKLHE